MEKKKLFRAFLFGSTVELSEVEVTKETMSSVWFINKNGKEVCERKNSTHLSFHTDSQKAKAYLFDKQKSIVESVQRNLEYQHRILNKIQGL